MLTSMISVLGQSPDKTLNGAIKVVRSNLKDDLNGNNSTGNEGFKSLQKFDNFSTRQFLAVLVFHQLCHLSGDVN